jgi:ubiquinone/menaquinone biosynthesis C-methylase UbiE
MVNICKNWTQWLKESRFSALSEEQKEQTLRWLESVRDVLIGNAQIKPGEIVIDIGTGTGLMATKALEVLNGTGEVIFSDKFEDCLVSCKEQLEKMGITSGYRMMNSPCEKIDVADNSIDKALMRSVLVHIVDKQPAVNEIFRILKPGGKFCAFEPIISSNTRYWELLNPDKVRNFEEFKTAENDFMSSSEDPMCNFDENTLAKNFEVAGFSDGSVDLQVVESNYVVNKNMVETWFATPPSPDRPTMKERFLKYFDEEKVNQFIEDVKEDLDGKFVTIKSNTVFMTIVK